MRIIVFIGRLFSLKKNAGGRTMLSNTAFLEKQIVVSSCEKHTHCVFGSRSNMEEEHLSPFSVLLMRPQENEYSWSHMEGRSTVVLSVQLPTTVFVFWSFWRPTLMTTLVLMMMLSIQLISMMHDMMGGDTASHVLDLFEYIEWCHIGFWSSTAPS